MGVPGFFMWLMKQYKNKAIVFSKSKALVNSPIHSIDYLLIDMNCMIHPECFKTLEDIKTTDIDKIEAKMRNNIILYLEKIIEHNMPHKGIFLAVDGVAPVAKMKQQRFRRFKSISDKELYDNLRRKHKKENPVYWNNSAITPGTNFMKFLNLRIIDWISDYTKKHKLEIIYSSCNEPGEGEHKLLQFIRNNKNKYNYSIYGLDADLIFLALSTGLDSIYLMREGKILKNDTKEASDGFNYVSIQIMKECIVDTMSKLFETNIKLNNNRLVDDFIFICYLMGNDFLPHLPALDIYNGAIDLLIECYVKTLNKYPNEYIVMRNGACDINMVVFNEFINRLATYEEGLLKDGYTKRTFSSKCFSSDPYDIELNRIENMKFKIDDPVQLGRDEMKDWRPRYYSHYTNATDDIETMSKNMVHSYMVGLKWVTCYYFDKCPDWDWFYAYDHPPFLVDMDKYKINFKEIRFTLGYPMTPFEQLLTVLPRQSSYLLPRVLQKIMLNVNSSAAHLYPSSFELDMIGKKKYWMVQPILPDMEIDLIRAIFKKYSKHLTDEEKHLNINIF